MKVLNEYPGSLHYWNKFEKTEWYCAHCGKQDVWDEVGDGDLFLGNESICIACGWACHYLRGPRKIKDKNIFGILEQLQSGVTKEPTTPFRPFRPED